MEDLKKIYQEEKIIEIENFLSSENSNNIYDFLDNIPDNWWSRSINIQSNDFQNVQNISDIECNKPVIQELTNLSYQSLNNNIFSYSFYRTFENHYNTCICELCKFAKFLRSEEFIKYISELTNIELTKTNEIFASKYTSGCFLGPHHDKTKGKIGIILYLTKDWKPYYGGILHIMDSTESEIIKSVVPKFNNLVVFDIPHQNGIPHYVSHVCPKITHKRYAISFWMS
jgi:Rps23 Pro-64 3,4-dihydroxylase Tpa1-like proline 4-hydroxylase